MSKPGKSRGYTSATFGSPSNVSQPILPYVPSKPSEGSPNKGRTAALQAKQAEAQREAERLRKAKKRQRSKRKQYGSPSRPAMRALILNEIRRLATANGGRPPNVERFEEKTGISIREWQGVMWAKWGDALVEAGFIGCVYLARSDEHPERYKIIGSNQPLLPVALPKAMNLVLIHAISTDDPAGIEAYWQSRFADHRADDQWFTLTPNDVAAFKRRKYQ